MGPALRSNARREPSALDIISSVLFFLLAIGVVGAGLAVVTLRNIIHSAVAMMVCFGSLAGMYALLGAPIVAAAQVLIYLGAISVLILFAIMLTQAGDANLPAPYHRQAATDDASGEHHEEDDRDVQSRLSVRNRALRASFGGRARF